MAKSVKVLVLRTAGTNCNEETAYAFSRCGGEVTQSHVNALISGAIDLGDFHILAIPGGFSYGDDIASGRILGNELVLKLKKPLQEFMAAGKLIIGICNGFQILVKAGILPGIDVQGTQEATLFHNDSAKFEARWVHLSVKGNSPWTQGIAPVIYLPVAHGEGKFIPRDQKILRHIKDNGQIVFTYCTANGEQPQYPQDPNGSVEHIAGICDPTGRVLGLMPHPERHFLFEQHPSWTRLSEKSEFGDGAQIFENGINYIKKNFK